MAEGVFEGLLDFLKGMDGGRVLEKPGSDWKGWDERKFKKWIIESFKIEDKTTNAMMLFGPLLMLNVPQQELLWKLMKAIQKGGAARFLVLKSRKLGVSTDMEILLLALAMMVKGITCAIIAHTDEASTKLFSILRSAYDHLGAELKRQFPLRYNTQSNMEFGNKNLERFDAEALGHVAKVKCITAGGQYPLAGDTVRALHLSECAKYDAVGDYDAQQRFILSAIGSVPKAGASLVVAESTANGQQGWFYDEWMRATGGTKGMTAEKNKGTIGWEAVFFSWLEDPACRAPVPHGYDWKNWYGDDAETESELREFFMATSDQLFFRRSIINVEMGGNFELFDQEFPTTPTGAFLASGRPAIPRRYIKSMETTVDDEYDCYMTKVVGGYQNQLSYTVNDDDPVGSE